MSAKRRVRLSVAMSLDGYIAGPGGESDWIVTDPEIDFTGLMGAFDTVLMGRNTYQSMRAQGGPTGLPGMGTFVFSHTLRQQDCPGVTVTADAGATLTELTQTAGRDIWLFGGGLLFRSLLEGGWVDSVEVAVVPVLLGGGLPLLPAPATRSTLRLVGHRVFAGSGIVSLNYVRA